MSTCYSCHQNFYYNFYDDFCSVLTAICQLFIHIYTAYVLLDIVWPFLSLEDIQGVFYNYKNKAWMIIGEGHVQAHKLFLLFMSYLDLYGYFTEIIHNLIFLT